MVDNKITIEKFKEKYSEIIGVRSGFLVSTGISLCATIYFLCILDIRSMFIFLISAVICYTIHVYTDRYIDKLAHKEGLDYEN